jgi:hypothetical protein
MVARFQFENLSHMLGGLGKSTNFIVLMAKLIINGENKGLHAFLVQIRDLVGNGLLVIL